MINIIIDKKPFAEGAMRAAFHMRDLSTSGHQSMYVAKMAKVAGTPVAQYFEDVKMQAEVAHARRRRLAPPAGPTPALTMRGDRAQAGKFAEEFNKRGVPKKVEFIAAYVLELIDRPNRPICGVERYVPGE